MPNPAMSASPRVYDAIKQAEGFSATAYKDLNGNPTYGYGQKVGVQIGMTCTEEQAVEMLEIAVGQFERFINHVVRVPLTQGQFDALVDFTYNEGTGRLLTSTLLKRLNGGDYAGACAELSKWTVAAGHVEEGLVKRRALEQSWFLEKP